MEKLTHQQMFDAALKGVLSNKDGLSFSCKESHTESGLTVETPQCFYNKENGDGCNAAYLVGEDRCKLVEGFWNNPDNLLLFQKHVPEENIEYIGLLQYVHDNTVTSYPKEQHMDMYKVRMREYATNHGLVYPEV